MSFESDSSDKRTDPRVSVCVYNRGVFSLFEKINTTTPWLSRLFKFLKTFPTTFLSALAKKKEITKIAPPPLFPPLRLSAFSSVHSALENKGDSFNKEQILSALFLLASFLSMI